jgi:hypothetical protein
MKDTAEYLEALRAVEKDGNGVFGLQELEIVRDTTGRWTS